MQRSTITRGCSICQPQSLYVTCQSKPSWVSILLTRELVSLPLATKLGQGNIYRPQRNCGQGYVFTRVCDSVHRGGSPGRESPPGRENPPGPGRHPPQTRQTPPGPGRHPSPAGRTPPGRETPPGPGRPPQKKTAAYGQ